MRKKLEKRFREYKSVRARMVQAKLDLEDIRMEEATIAAATFDEKFGSDVSSTVENKVMKKLEMEDELKRNIKESELELKKLDNLLSVLDQREKTIIEERYINRLNYNYLVGALDREYNTIKAIERQAFKKMIGILN